MSIKPSSEELTEAFSNLNGNAINASLNTGNAAYSKILQTDEENTFILLVHFGVDNCDNLHMTTQIRKCRTVENSDDPTNFEQVYYKEHKF